MAVFREFLPAPRYCRICFAAAGAVLLAGCSGSSSPVPNDTGITAAFVRTAYETPTLCTTPNADPASCDIAAPLTIPARTDTVPVPTDKEFAPTTQSPAQALALVNAHDAYARGYTGKNVTIGILDEGFDPDNPEIAGQIPPSSVFRINRIRISGRVQRRIYHIMIDPNQRTHGTAVAALAAGARDNDGVSEIQGIAYDSQLELRTLNIVKDTSVQLPRNLNPSVYYANAFSMLLSELARANADIVNYSLAAGTAHNTPSLNNAYCDSKEFITSITNDSGICKEDEALFQLMGESLNGVRTETGDVMLMVSAAGNNFPERVHRLASNPDYANHPAADAALMVYYPDLRNRMVTTVAVDESGVITVLSNRCGIAGPWCIAAPGEDLKTTNSSLESGTSYAAPFVSGALAILIEQFGLPDNSAHHGNAQILRRLLQTANKSGIYAPDSIYGSGWTLSQTCGGTGEPACQFNAIYGMGLLDLDAATRPIGQGTALYHPQGEGHTSGATRALLGKTRIEVSPAFGDALSLALEGKTAYFFDALEFAFPMPAAALAPVPHSNTLANRLAVLGRIERHVAGNFHGMGFATGEANSKAGLYLMPVNMAEGREGFTGLDSYLSLAQEGQGFAAGWKRERHSLGFALLTSEEERNEPGSRVMVLAYGYETPKGVGVSLRAGWAEEESALLGAETSGLYGQSEAGRTFFASIGASLSLAKGWHGFADIEAGRTEASQAASGAFETSALVSASMAAGVWRKNMVAEGDWLGFMVSQPLRIETGNARFSYASGRKSNAVVVMTHEEFSLTPSGRTLEFQTAYRAPESKSGFTWQAAAGISLAPRHRANANPETWGLVSVTHRF